MDFSNWGRKHLKLSWGVSAYTCNVDTFTTSMSNSESRKERNSTR